MLVFGADRAQQLVGAPFADPGRSRHLAGSQAGAGGPLAGDQLPHPSTAVARLTCGVGWGWQASNLRPSDYESLALTD